MHEHRSFIYQVETDHQYTIESQMFDRFWLA